MYWKWLVYTLWIAIFTVADVSTKVAKEETCSSRKKSCLEKRDRFLAKYLRHRKNGNNNKYNDECKKLQKVDSCFQNLTRNCRYTARPGTADEHWQAINKTLLCACSGNHNCKKAVRCFKNEHKAILLKGCDAHKINLRDDPFNPCHHAREFIHCRKSVVESACDAQAGSLAYHFAKFSVHSHVTRHKCTVNQHNYPYKGFRYTTCCPANFPKKIGQCVEKKLKNDKMIFEEANDLILESNEKEVRQACRAYHQYQKCVQPVRQACPDGVRTLYDYSSRLRTYLFKSHYICHEHKEYVDHISCYQQVLHNDTLQQCNHVWGKLKPLFDTSTSHQFFCDKNSANSTLMRQELDNLRVCYHKVFQNKCGRSAADIMDKMTSQAFRDPYYLRFKYKPRCRNDPPFDTKCTELPEKSNKRTQTKQGPRVNEIVGQNTAASSGSGANSLTMLLSVAVCVEMIKGWRRMEYLTQ